MSILSIGELLDLGGGGTPSTGLIPYSALEYNETGAISGISGSAIAGGVDTTIVSSIASSYVESGISSKVDQSAFEDCCSAMSAVVSAKLDASASGQFQPSGNYQPSGDYYSATNPSGFITTADITGKLDSTASSLFQPSGDYADSSSLSGKLDASASSMFQPSGEYAPTGDYAYNSSLSSKLDASASSQFAPSGDYVFNSSYSSFTGDVTNNISSISSIVSGITGDWSSKADTSALDNKMDKSASSQFAPSGDYAYNSALSSYVNYSAISGEDNRITSIHGSAVGEVIPPLTTLVVDSATMSSVIDFDNKFYIGVKDGVFAGTGVASGKLDSSAFSSYSSDVDSAISGKLDQSAFSAYSAGVTVVQIVNNSSEATGSNILYVVTGSV